jgi:hypothetical protein
VDYTIQCDCGELLGVGIGEAGSRKACTGCGEEVSVPSLSVLRESAPAQPPTVEIHRQASNPGLIFAFTAIILAVFAFVSPTYLVGLGSVMFIFARAWFALQILSEMALPNAILVFCVPFMPTFFLFKRFDITWQPFSFGIAGIVAVIFGSTLA